MEISAEYIINKIAQAGVVGAGGAGFPTHAKLNKSVEQVIANGVECEPLLYSDKTLLEQQAPQVIQGLLLVMAAAQAHQGIIAVKRKHGHLIDFLLGQIKPYPQISLFPLDDFYPAGDEHTLINEVTGKQVPPGQLPLSVRVLVNNVTTLWQVAEAFAGRPVTSRYVTVTGEVKQPVVVQSPIGTPIVDLIALAGGTRLSDFRVIVGGPMMGQVVVDHRQEFTGKTTSGIIVVPNEHFLVLRNQVQPWQQLKRVQSTCENCRMCTDLCPRYLLGHPLEPHNTVRVLSQQQVEAGQHFTSALLCCNCGICDTVACPCNLSPRALYQALRKELAGQKFPNPVFSARSVSIERRQRRTPLSRVLQRLNIVQYAENKPVCLPLPVTPSRVVIKLKQHVGVSATPNVKVGDKVNKGCLIGDVPTGKLGAKIHASINGTVTQVCPESIEITSFFPT